MAFFKETIPNWDPIPSFETDPPYAQFIYGVSSSTDFSLISRCMGHRYSGCSFQGNFFTIQPRMNDDVKYYLVLQNNPYYAGDNGDITSPSSYAIGYDTTDSGNQQRAAPGASYLSVDDPSNAESARFLTAAVAGSTGGAYACWMAVPEDETTGDPGASTPPLYIWPISVTQAAGQRPVVTAPNVDSTLKFTLTGAPTQGTNCPRDLCAVAIGTAIYFFICYWNDPDLYYFAFDGENVSEVVPCDAFAGRMGGPVTELWSIDATAVYG
jgi:hypothetical protein